MYTISYSIAHMSRSLSIQNLDHDEGLFMDDKMKGHAAAFSFLDIFSCRWGRLLGYAGGARKIVSIFLVSWGACWRSVAGWPRPSGNSK